MGTDRDVQYKFFDMMRRVDSNTARYLPELVDRLESIDEKLNAIQEMLSENIQPDEPHPPHPSHPVPQPLPPSQAPSTVDVGLAVHSAPTTSPPIPVSELIGRLRALDIRWYKLLDAGDRNNIELVEALTAAGIQPIIRLWRGNHLPNDVAEVSQISRLIRAGARWFEPLNEPNISPEWAGGYSPNWNNHSDIETVAGVWYRAARQIAELGGSAAFPAMAPTDRGGVNHMFSSQVWAQRLIDEVDRSFGNEVRAMVNDERVWLAVHTAAMGRPLEMNPELDNGHYDDMCLRGYERTKRRFEDAFGPVFTASTEGGVFSPRHMASLGGWGGSESVVLYDDPTGEHHSSEQFYNSDTWGSIVLKAASQLPIPLCHWTFSDEGVHDQRWIGSGWYGPNGEPRSPVFAIRDKQ